MKTKTIITLIFQVIVKNSESTCDLIDSEVYGRLRVSKDDELSTKCANNLVFKSKDGAKYCLKKEDSSNTSNIVDKLVCVEGMDQLQLKPVLRQNKSFSSFIKDTLILRSLIFTRIICSQSKLVVDLGLVAYQCFFSAKVQKFVVSC